MFEENPHILEGSIRTRAGTAPRVSSSLVWADRIGSVKSRWGIGRMGYTVTPGLYALGEPDDRSPVLATANYKMSFDRLRSAMPGRSAWILVLDTKGINVWCAAGKGTFGTDELVGRIEACGLGDVVSHRELILPQLGAPGVAAFRVRKLSGFKVIYGPVEAKDLPAFLDDDKTATPEMRRKRFPTRERVALIPMELVISIKWFAGIFLVLFLIGGLDGSAGFWGNALHHGALTLPALIGALVAGAVLTPLLLPWLPGKAFSLKGLFAGLMVTLLVAAYQTGNAPGPLEISAWFLIAPALAAYLAMNFTGASTFTSFSGVKKEMKWAVPMEITAGAAGLCLWIVSLFLV
jgi:acetyl-CoA decarbonylase/synthase complex subunit gamma